MRNYEELVDRLRAGTYTAEELSIIIPKAADAIDELSKLQASYRQVNWIRVEDRLPDPRDSDWVIGIANGKVGNMEYRDAVVMVAYDQDEGVWYLDSDPDVKVKVTHWMPLPEPPSGES